MICDDEYSNEICDGLFLGSLWSTSPKELRKNKIDCVLNVAGLETNGNRAGQYSLTDYLVLPISDSWDQADKMFNYVFPNAMEFLETHLNHGRRVLVNCSAGVSRSATVVIAWLMWSDGMTREAATRHVLSKRSKIQPNHGFVTALDRWELELKNSERIK